jgi:hypothetical protein
MENEAIFCNKKIKKNSFSYQKYLILAYLRLKQYNLIQNFTTMQFFLCPPDPTSRPTVHTYVVACFLITPHLKIGAY